MRRFRRLFFTLMVILVITVGLCCLALAVGLWRAPVQWQGLGWDNGLLVANVTVEQQSCSLAQLQGLRLTGLRPLTLSVDALDITPCNSSAESETAGHTLDALRWLALWPFELTVDGLNYAVDSDHKRQLAVDAQQNGSLLQLKLTQQDSMMLLVYRWGDGTWQLDGKLHANQLLVDWVGQLTFHGNGHWDLTKQPLGDIELSLHQLGPEAEQMSGRITALIDADGVQLEPFKLEGDNKLTLVSHNAVKLPLSYQGEFRPALSLTYGHLTLTANTGRLFWRHGEIGWQGDALLAGQWSGYQVNASWSGQVNSADGILGKLKGSMVGDELRLNASSQLDNDLALSKPLHISLAGHAAKVPFGANLLAQRSPTGFEGQLNATASPTLAETPVSLQLISRWRWQLQQPNQLTLLPGGSLTQATVATPGLLVKPAKLTLKSPLLLSQSGLEGTLTFNSGGLLLDRWRLPPWSADISLCGWCFRLQGKVAEWNTELRLDGRNLLERPHGALFINGELLPAMSRGLPAQVDSGELQASGIWHWRSQPELDSVVTLTNLAARSGSINANAIDGDLALQWRDDDFFLRSVAPLTIGMLDVGVPISDIKLSLKGSGDQWTVSNLSASLLGGSLSAKRLDWPSAQYQSVRLKGIESGALTALQSQPAVQVSGPVGGYIPLRLADDGISIRNGKLTNEAPLHFSLSKQGAVGAASASNRWLTEAFDVISLLDINQLEAKLDMSSAGELQANIHVEGKNVNYKRPVVLNYSHHENIFVLLQSLRIADQLVDSITSKGVTP